MSDVMEIGYLTVPVAEYVEAITAADTRDKLVAAIKPYEIVAGDALDAARRIAASQWPIWRAGLAKERRGRGRFAGDAWARRFGAILCPEVMTHVAVIAQQYHAPWGTAYLRLRDLGFLVETNGRARLQSRFVRLLDTGRTVRCATCALKEE